jgi:hypothetical protein
MTKGVKRVERLQESDLIPLARNLVFALVLVAMPALAENPSPITVEKIKYIANNCGSIDGFATWLRRQPGVTDVDDDSVLYLTSLPAKNDVGFKLKGRLLRVWVSPTMSFDTIKAAYKANAKTKTSVRPKEVKPINRRVGSDLELAIEETSRMLEEYRAMAEEEAEILDFLLRQYEASDSSAKAK